MSEEHICAHASPNRTPDGLLHSSAIRLPRPKHARERLRRELDENWGRESICAWNSAGWVDMPARVGDRIGKLIGAPAGSVVAVDPPRSTSTRH